MNKIKNIAVGLAVCISLVSLAISLEKGEANHKIAFVRSVEIVEKFYGMQEAQELYFQKVNQWGKELDSLNDLLEKVDKKLQELNGAVNKKVLLEKHRIQSLIKNYTAELEQNSNEDYERITQGALNQINSYVKEYAKENDISLVIGVTLSGNVLYGEDAIDITEDIIDGMNKQYKE